MLVSRSPGWGSLMKDIELLEVSDPSAISSCDAVASAFQVSCLVSNSSDMDVLVHQLHVLTEEFPTAGLDSALGDWTSSGYEGAHLTDSFGALAFLLEDLCRLESAHASAVNSCRARDGIKGREVIPDYDAVNAAGGECLSDPIAKRALDQAGEVSDAVAMLCDGNAYTTKMRLCH